jgi:hypothetical protein
MVHPGTAFQAEIGDLPAVADRADHGEQLTLGDVRGATDLLDSFHDLGDLFLGRPLFHHNHHFLFKPFLYTSRLYFRPGLKAADDLSWHGARRL